MKKILAFHLVLFLISSCASTPTQKMAPNSYEAQILSKIEQSCQNESNPGFSAALITSQMLPPLNLEGVWKNHFHQIDLQVSDILGQNSYFIELNENKVSIKSKEHNQEIQPMLIFLEWIGSQGLRSLTCGHYAIAEQSTESIVQEEGSHMWKGLSKASFQNRKLDIENNYIFQKNPIEKINIHSKFFYSIFKYKLNLGIDWEAQISQSKIDVKKIHLQKENEKYLLSFSEYE